MLGYYKNPEATSEVIDSDGFLHTGDIGRLVDGKYLQITDRKKEIFKLSLGKYVAPQVIENLLKESPYIQNCFVFGENQKFASAVIIPDFDHLRHWAQENGLGELDDKQLAADPKAVAFLHSIVDQTPLEAVFRSRLLISGSVLRTRIPTLQDIYSGEGGEDSLRPLCFSYLLQRTHGRLRLRSMHRSGSARARLRHQTAAGSRATLHGE